MKQTSYKTNRINKWTGGMIGNYVDKSLCFEDEDINDVRNYTLENSFIYNGLYIGGYERGWWYFKNNLLICPDHPIGVAIVLTKPAKQCESFSSYLENGQMADEEIKGFLGYSHRGGQTFCVGDKIFDAEYIPKQKDFPYDEWLKYEKKQEESIKIAMIRGVSKTAAIKENPIKIFIPLTKRGSRVIKSLKDAKISAINFSNSIA